MATLVGKIHKNPGTQSPHEPFISGLSTLLSGIASLASHPLMNPKKNQTERNIILPLIICIELNTFTKKCYAIKKNYYTY